MLLRIMLNHCVAGRATSIHSLIFSKTVNSLEPLKLNFWMRENPL